MTAALRLALCATTLLSAALPSIAQEETRPPIVFVHGDSDSASAWIAQIWRFESNGYPADRLFAVDIPSPSARADDTVAEENRSSTEDAARAVAATVEEALAASGADQVVLVANSRGCQTARNYEKNLGGAGKVEAMVLTGCVHNGVYVAPDARPNAEYNGAGRFLTALNEGGLPEGVDVTIIRSDRFDLYAQESARFIGNPDGKTGVSFDAPELDGAENIVLDGVDHRETAYSPQAFEVMYEAITGEAPQTREIEAEAAPELSGKVSAFVNGAPSNLGLEGAAVRVFAVDAGTGERMSETPAYEAVVAADGRWGPFTAAPDQAYEFVVEAEGEPTTRIYRSPFPRSSDLVNLRLYPEPSVGDAPLEGETVSLMRPRGYFGTDDGATLDGAPLAGLPARTDVPSVWRTAVAVEGDAPKTVTASFGTETIAARTSPQDADDRVWIELTY